jgi:multicomponent Na+:H+ antiporter subunit C
MEIFPVIMFFIGFYGLIISKKIIKSIIFILVMEVAVVMFFLTLGARSGFLPPIGQYGRQYLEYAVDPLPQALMITAIIIGLAVTAVNLTMLISLYRESRTTDWDTVRNIVRKKTME